MAETVSIEYAHIYTNQHISQEHELSVDQLTETIESFTQEGKRTNLVVMVDDYSFPDPTFDYDSFSTWLGGKGFKPDLLFRESQLIPACDEVLSLIGDEKLKNQLLDYIKTKKYPCSLFIAAWYMLRLGKLSSPLFPDRLIADELFNILPDSFKPFEDKGLEIIGSTKFSEAVGMISYSFISGRLIA